MDPEIVKYITMAAGVAVGTMGPAIAMGMIASKGLESIGRNPETENAERTTMLLALAFVESLGIFSLLVALIIKFVK